MNKRQGNLCDKVNLKNYRSTKTLIKNYFTVLYKIIVSNGVYIIYLFMIWGFMANGGLLYMVYPFLIFGYSIMLEREPGKNFWNFVVFYTSFLIFIQYVINMALWNEYGNSFAQKFYQVSLDYNLGLMKLQFNMS